MQERPSTELAPLSAAHQARAIDVDLSDADVPPDIRFVESTVSVDAPVGDRTVKNADGTPFPRRGAVAAQGAFRHENTAGLVATRANSSVKTVGSGSAVSMTATVCRP